MPTLRQDRKRWTLPEVRALIAAQAAGTPRYELVDGELLVTPSPAGVHQLIVGELLVLLHPYVRTERLGEAIASPSDVELGENSLTQPDVYVVSLEEAARIRAVGFRSVPTTRLILATEVLSPSSTRHDRGRKRPLYQKHVGEYWIVDGRARVIERWLRDRADPETVAQQLVWQPTGAGAPLVIDVAALFARALDG